MKNETIYYARKCSITNEGMNEGWLDEQNLMYFKYKEDVVDYTLGIIKQDLLNHGIDIKFLPHRSDDDVIEYGYEYYDIYFTEWECETDFQYKEIKGKIIEL